MSMGCSLTVKRAREAVKTSGQWDRADWSGVEPIRMDQFVKTRPEHFPRVQMRMLYDDAHVHVMFRVEDRYVRAVATEPFGNVWEDSCVEFFFTPYDRICSRYFNLEINCIGTALMYHQAPGGRDRVFLTEADLKKIEIVGSLPAGQPIDPEIAEPVEWVIEARIPWAMLGAYTDLTPPGPGVRWRGNFYKCADKCSHPHWLTWSPIPLPKPNFHQPCHFGLIEFE